MDDIKLKPSEPIKLKSEVASMLVKQVSHEMHNATIYKHLSFLCSKNGYLVAEKFFEKQAQGEIEHSDLVMSYIKDRNFEFTTFNIPPTSDIKMVTLVDAINMALIVEQRTTKLLSDIQIKAEEVKDRLTYNFMDKMLTEQIEEESILTNGLAVAKGLSSNKFEQLHLEHYFEQFI